MHRPSPHQTCVPSVTLTAGRDGLPECATDGKVTRLLFGKSCRPQLYLSLRPKWLTPDARCKVSLVRNVGVCPSLAWQASEDGFGVGERGLRRAWAGDAILNIIVDLTLSWAGCTHRRSVAPGASTLPGWLARRAPRGATTSQEAEGAVSGVRSAQWTTGKTITRSTAPTTSSRVMGAH